ncbi:MAG: nicotinate phosphoribosyltransferase [Acidimicrobiales bacterium]|nr:nicotinate phosphoribosyltransferase [Acidimicrobiales bacterium]
MVPPSDPSNRRVDLAGTALLTDHYELTMVDAAIRSGVAFRRAVFECFFRRLPPGRRYGVVAGTGRLLDAIDAFRFDGGTLSWLRGQGFLAADTLDWLADYRFGGTISGYREGELCFPGSPVLTVEGTFAEAVVLETLVLSVLNHDSAVAAAGSRMVGAAAGRPLLAAGGRRTAEWAAPAAARAAYLVGFAATSNLEAGRRWGVPTGGTTAHSFVLAHAQERDAFDAQLAVTGPATTLLVDTYDLEAGIRNAVAAAGPGLGAVRIDSGDPLEQAGLARKLLDDLGATQTQIVLSGDLDEYAIETLLAAGAPVDRMLVGTQLVTGSGAPTAGMVYKLVAVADRIDDQTVRPVAKTSAGKESRGGHKWAGRRFDTDGYATAEVVTSVPVPDRTIQDGMVRSLQVTFVERGERVDRTTLADARLHHQAARATLRPEHLELAPGPVALPTVAG